ncbi:long-chain specific acyl-CoA dehydrogenase, mitochondrial-like isoform X2 [Oscarella lobularis]
MLVTLARRTELATRAGVRFRRVFSASETQMLRESVRAFVNRHVAPYINQWEEEEGLPRELHKRAGDAGILGVIFPEKYGGLDGSHKTFIDFTEELSVVGAGGLQVSLWTHNIALPPILAHGSEAMKNEVAPAVIKGDKIAALASTEPSGGSDVANIKTTAKRDGNYFVINGCKTLITSGSKADWISVVARTGGDGIDGLSLILVDGTAPGLTRTKLQTMGWRCSDTATLMFDDVRVPVDRLIGPLNKGFKMLMETFNSERFLISNMAVAFAKVCLSESLDWAKQRETFGSPLIKRQVIRHKLVDMKTAVVAADAFLNKIAHDLDARAASPADLSMLKNHTTSMLEFVAGEAMQIFGGAGFVRGSKVERIYRETKVLTIGGGSREVMKDLAARQMH